MADKDEGVREAVGVFVTEEALQEAIDELLSSGFNQADLSLLASEEAVTEKLGHRYRRVSELEDAPGVPGAEYVSPESRGDAEGAVIGALMYVGAGILMGRWQRRGKVSQPFYPRQSLAVVWVARSDPSWRVSSVRSMPTTSRNSLSMVGYSCGSALGTNNTRSAPSRS